MAKADRLLQLMQCLRTLHSPVQAHQLSIEVGVSLRTIYRDIEALRHAGALIDGEAGVGYTIQEDPALPPMMFSRDEMEALVLGLREVSEIADPVLAIAAENALSKLRASLPASMHHEMEHATLYAKRFITRPEISIDVDVLRRATRSEHILEIDYSDEADHRTQRSVLPLAIVYFEKAHMLLAFCNLRQDFRSFRLDRIKHLNATTSSFRPRRVPLLREYKEILSQYTETPSD